MLPLEPLSPHSLSPALVLVAESFPTDLGYQWALPACAFPSELGNVRRAAGLSLARQWVMLGDEGEIPGTFGLYATDRDQRGENDFVILNWFCVHPALRGHGQGRQLWHEVVRAARDTGASRLIFYSSNEPEHLCAERLYLAAGCARRLGPFLPESSYRLTFFDYPLSATSPADSETIRRIDASLLRLVALDNDSTLVTAAENALPAGQFAFAA